MNETETVISATEAYSIEVHEVVIGTGTLLWTRYAGRDSDGDKFAHTVLSDGSDIIYARIDEPCVGDEYQYRVDFYISTVETEASAYSSLRFLSLAMAQAYAEKIIAQKRAKP